VDTDATFNINRFQQISPDDKKSIGENILIFNPDSFDQQSNIIENLENYITPKTRLIIIDSISKLYRAEYLSTSERFWYNRELNRQLAYLNGLAFQHKLAVVITSQVRTALSIDANEIEPIAKRTIFHWPTTIIRLDFTDSTKMRRAIIERHNSKKISIICKLKMGKKGLT
jgi:DNA repair protein RadB